MTSLGMVRDVLAAALPNVNPTPTIAYCGVAPNLPLPGLRMRGVGDVLLPITGKTVESFFDSGSAIGSRHARTVDPTQVDVQVAPEWNHATPSLVLAFPFVLNFLVLSSVHRDRRLLIARWQHPK